MQIFLAQHFHGDKQYLIVAPTLNEATIQAGQLPGWRGGNVYEITDIHGLVFNQYKIVEKN